jgi:hypothetical protein
MLLEQLAWLASVVSAIAIVVSAIYASIEIRHNTVAVRASAFQQVVDSFAANSFDIAKDRRLVDLYLRAGKEFASLEEVERTQYSLMLLSFLRRAENVLFQSSIRMLHTEHWSGIRNSIEAILAPPGAQGCWCEIKGRFNPEFRAFVDSLVAAPSQESSGNAVKSNQRLERPWNFIRLRRERDSIVRAGRY